MSILKFMLGAGLLLTSFSSCAQDVSNQALIDTAVAVLPRMIALAEAGAANIRALRTAVSPSSYFVADSPSNAEWAGYFGSSVNFPGAAETRIIEILTYKGNTRKVLWSVIVSREYGKKYLMDGRSLELYRQLDSTLAMHFPGAQRLHAERKAAGAGSPESVYSKLLLPGHYVIGIEAWHSKAGSRNMVRLYVASLSAR